MAPVSICEVLCCWNWTFSRPRPLTKLPCSGTEGYTPATGGVIAPLLDGIGCTGWTGCNSLGQECVLVDYLSEDAQKRSSHYHEPVSAGLAVFVL